MDVTETHNACTPPSNGQPGCGCKPRASRAAKAAVVAAGTAAACTACCVLPFTLPAVVLANVGGIIALLDHAHGWVTWLAVIAVGGAWVWIVRHAITSRATPAKSTLAMMGVATVVIALAASWPQIKPALFYAFGITKKNPDKN